MWTIEAPAAAHRLASAATSAGVQGTLGFCSRPRAPLRQALIMILSISLSSSRLTGEGQGRELLGSLNQSRHRTHRPLVQAQIPLRVLTQDAALGPVRQVVPLADRRD